MIPLLALAAFSLPAAAQLSGSMAVEGEFDPQIIETERIYTLPKAIKYELPAANLDYDRKGVVADFRPGLMTMGVTGRLTDRSWRIPHGWVDARLGSWLDARLLAGATLLSDQANTLTATLDYRSTSLYRMPEEERVFGAASKRKFYDGTLSLDYSRLIGAEGLLQAALSYRVNYLNYYGTPSPDYGALETAPGQTLNQARASVAYASSPSTIRGCHAGASVEYTAYRALYGFTPAGVFSRRDGDRETLLSLEGGYAFPLAEPSAFALDAKADFIFYGENPTTLFGIDVTGRHNYGTIALRPSYRYENEAFNVKAGLDVAVTYDAMGSQEGEKFQAFSFAPDVAAAYHNGSLGVFLEATGGVRPLTLAAGEAFNPWQMPWQLSTRPLYTPADVRLGLNVGPFAGFSASVSGRFVSARNVPLGGWYQALLGGYIDPAYPLDMNEMLNPYGRNVNLNGFAVSAALRYAYGTMAAISVEATYTPQGTDKGIFNGFDRPRWVLTAMANVRPIRKLNIEVGYDYRGVRNCYGMTVAADGMPEIAPYALPDVTNLHAKVAYDLLSNFTLYVKGDNLLNTHPVLLPGLQSAGVVISGGFTLIF